MFLKEAFMLTKVEFIWLKYSKNSNIVKYYSNLKYLYYILIYLYYVIKPNFQAAITAVFSVKWSFRNYYNMLIWCQETYFQC